MIEGIVDISGFERQRRVDAAASASLVAAEPPSTMPGVTAAEPVDIAPAAVIINSIDGHGVEVASTPQHLFGTEAPDERPDLDAMNRRELMTYAGREHKGKGHWATMSTDVLRTTLAELEGR